MDTMGDSAALAETSGTIPDDTAALTETGATILDDTAALTETGGGHTECNCCP